MQERIQRSISKVQTIQIGTEMDGSKLKEKKKKDNSVKVFSHGHETKKREEKYIELGLSPDNCFFIESLILRFIVQKNDSVGCILKSIYL